MRLLAGLRAGAGFWHRFGRERSGTTAIEFAMVFGPFLALLFAIIETALIYFAEFSIDAAAHKAARVIRTGSAQGAQLTADQFKTIVCKDIVWLPCDQQIKVDVRSFDCFAQAAQNMPNPLNADGTLTTTPPQFNMGGPAKVVIVSVFFDWQLMAKIPGLGTLMGMSGLGMGNLPDGSRLISATTAFRTESYGVPPATNC